MEDIDSLRKELEQRSSEELTSILRNRDEEEWRPEVFDVVASILKGRGISPEAVAAMGPEGTDVIESAPTVTVATFISPAEAQASRMALEEAGIAAWITDEQGGTMYGVGIGTRLQVRVKDVATAREVLSTAPAAAADLPPDLAESSCPKCGSRNVAPEARLADEATRPADASSGRKWYCVCADCHEAWPL